MRRDLVIQGIVLIIGLFWGVNNASAGNPPDYVQRQESYIQTALNNFRQDDIILQAYKGLPVDQPSLNNLLAEAQTVAEADFRIIRLVRVLFFSNGQYDAQILPVLRGIKFWLHPEGDKAYVSENHIIMWASSNWLLYEKYNFPIDATLRTRIVHYLNLKIRYGYYEFFSTVYAPYTLAGLLNLADFAQDAEIKSLATQAAQRLMKDFLLVSNDKGVFYPAAGRNTNSYYNSPYGSNSNKIIYLLTGFGEVPNSGSHNSNFLATSSIPVADVINSWAPELNISYQIGHSLRDGIDNINSGLSRFDRTVFQWISGAYFHPDVAGDSYWLIDSLKLYNAVEQFSLLAPIFELPIDFSNLAEPMAKLLGSVSRSSVICGQTVDIFRNRSVVLTSVQDYWKGRMGFQQFPWVANTGTGAVYTQSGKVQDFSVARTLNNNSHLPYIDQKDNVALIMYRHDRDLELIAPLLGNTLDVSLRWPDEVFDEQREYGNWILGREDQGYVAVYRHCIDSINGITACGKTDGQTWVAVVGNQDMYGSFDQFEEVIKQSHLQTRWYFNIATLQWVYYSKIEIDGKTIEHAWGDNIFSGPTQPTGLINNTNDALTLNVYPNPATTELRVDLSAFRGQEASIRIHNLLGQEIFSMPSTRIGGDPHSIGTAGWSNGSYVISVKSETQQGFGKFIIQH